MGAATMPQTGAHCSLGLWLAKWTLKATLRFAPISNVKLDLGP